MLKQSTIIAMVAALKTGAVKDLDKHQMLQSGNESDFNFRDKKDIMDTIKLGITSETALQDEAKVGFAGLESESIAGLVMVAKAFHEKAGRLKASTPDFGRKNTVSAMEGEKLEAGALQRGIYGDKINLVAGLQNFAPTEVDTFTAYSAVYNISASKQSKFADLYFKPVMQDPLAASFDLEVNVISTYENTAAPLGGAPYSRNLKSLIKQISTGYDLIREDLRLYPISRTENEAFLLTDLEYPQTIVNATEQVAPVKDGVEVDMGNLGLSTALAARGAVDSSDTLSRDISLESIYVEISKTVAGDVKTDVLKIPLNKIQYNKFVRKVNGQDVEMDLNEQVKLAFTVATLKTYVIGTGNGVLDGLLDTYNVQFQLRLTGNANLSTRNIWVRNTVELHKVFNALGEDVTEAQTVSALKAVFNTAKAIGWFPKCYAGNENLRNKGLRITQSSYYVSFPIAYNSPVQIDSPLIDMPGSNGDKLLMGAINITGFQMDQAAIKSIMEYKDILRNFDSNVYTDIDLYKNLGVTAFMVFPRFEERDTNVSEITSNVSSKDYVEDLSGAICADIRDVIIKLAAGSRIQDALRVQLGEEIIGVSIGVSTELSAYVTKENLKLGANYEIKIESTNHTAWKDQIVITLAKRDGAASDKPHILDRGWMVYYPDVAGTAQFQENEAQKTIFVCRPGYNHINNMPIMGYIKVSGLETANKEIMARAKVYRLNSDNEVING